MVGKTLSVEDERLFKDDRVKAGYFAEDFIGAKRFVTNYLQLTNGVIVHIDEALPVLLGEISRLRQMVEVVIDGHTHQDGHCARLPEARADCSLVEEARFTLSPTRYKPIK